MWRERSKWPLIVIGVLFVAFLVAMQWDVIVDLVRHGRVDYEPIDITAEGWWADPHREGEETTLVERLDHARAEGEGWVSDPVQIALRLAGYPRIEGGEPDWVNEAWDSTELVIVVIGKDFLGDDATKARETRVELHRDDGEWEVLWIGSRHKCYRDLSS